MSADDPTPAECGRAHALQRLAEAAQGMADAREPVPAAASDDARAYLAAFADTCRSVASRLRSSPGFRP